MEKISKLMVIDDDNIDQMAVQRYCKIGHLASEVVSLGDAESAMYYLKTMADSEDDVPDVIFLDINLPKLDGWDFLSQYGELAPFLNKKVDIYMFSSSISEEDTARARNSEYVKDYIYKPISLEKLKRVLSNYTTHV